MSGGVKIFASCGHFESLHACREMSKKPHGFIKRFWPLIVICSGIALLITAHLHYATFAEIPGQDPAEEMSAQCLHHAQIASAVGSLGLVVFGFGLLAWLIRCVARSKINLPLKLAFGSLLLGVFLPATPGMFRGNWEPVGTAPGALLLVSDGFSIFHAIESYYQNRDDPSYDFMHFSSETLVPCLKGLAVVVALLFFCLVAFIARLRSGLFRIVPAVAILAGGFCFVWLCYPGYPPVGNGYMYYPGAYFLMLAFPLAAFALLRGQTGLASELKPG